MDESRRKRQEERLIKRRSMLYQSFDSSADVYDRSVKDLNLKTFDFNNIVFSIEKSVQSKESETNHKMKRIYIILI